MAVYEHTYRPYAGPLTPSWSRFLIIPRHAYEHIFQSKLYVAFFALSFVCPLVMAILIYLHHNVNALALMELRVGNLIPINSYFFRTFISIQSTLGFWLTILIGPALISRDLANNALPLYLCRPFSRAEYVLGKASVLLILLSGVTWIPGLLLFVFQSYLEGAGWFGENLWIAGALVLTSWVWILILTLAALSLSAWIKWRLAASGALFILFTIPNVACMLINGIFHIRWANLVNLFILIQTVTDGLFRQPNSLDLPGWMVLPEWSAWGALAAFCALCLLLLARKVRAYEVVR